MDFVSRFLRIFHTTFSNMRPSFHNKPSAFTRFSPNRTVSKSKVTCFSWLYISLLLHNRLCIVCNICEDLQRNFDEGCSGLASVLFLRHFVSPELLVSRKCEICWKQVIWRLQKAENFWDVCRKNTFVSHRVNFIMLLSFENFLVFNPRVPGWK